MPRQLTFQFGLRRLAAIAAIVGGLADRAAAQVRVAEWHGTHGGYFGGTLVNAGDVDGDGHHDLLVGESTDSTVASKSGRLWVYSGRTFTVIRSHDGTQADERLGVAAAAMGDVDDDGFDDYAAGSSGFDTPTDVDAGRITLWSGGTGAVLWTVDGSTAGGMLGGSLTAIVDSDGDDIPQLLAGQESLDQALILDTGGNVTFTLLGDAGSYFGLSSARTGDVDGDGFDDFLVSAPYYSSSTVDYIGEVRVFSGWTFQPLFRFEGDEMYDGFGISTAGIDDVDGDGIPDLLVGADTGHTSYGHWVGYARVVSGSDGTTLRTEYGGQNEKLGSVVARMEDMDHDGIDDYAARTGVNSYGLVRVYSGRDGSVLWEFEGTDSSSGFDWWYGSAIATGDFNGDSIDDVAIGAPRFEDWTYADLGGAYVYLVCPARWENYGAGWPGKNGVPALTALDDPGVGESISLQLDNSLGADTVALLCVGFDEDDVPTSADGSLLLVPTLIAPLSLPAGGLVISDTLPDDAALYCFDVFVQALEADSFASKKISFTRGLVLHCGFDL